MQPFLAASISIIFQLVISATHLRLANCLPGCRTQCGAITINYPFGLDDGCGAPEYRTMLNCTGDLFFQTPSGAYKVQSIDYDKKTVVIFDPSMSTCTMLQPRHDFALSDIQAVMIPPSPTSAFALLNCSIDSPLLNRYRSLCFNFSDHSCDELYGSCASFRVLLRNVTSFGNPSCCFTDYATLKYMNMDMNIIDCTHYTTVYNVDDLKGVGPLDWPYGIELAYTTPNNGCDRCQRSGGTCGFNTETQGMLCLCSSGANTTRDCGNVTEGGSRLISITLFRVAILVVAAAIGGLF